MEYADIYLPDMILEALFAVVTCLGEIGVQRRSWAEISADILEVALTPSNKMRIMYKANLNFERFNKYFYDFLEKGFIEEKNDSNGRLVYKTTERGRALLEAVRKAQEIFSSEEP